MRMYVIVCLCPDCVLFQKGLMCEGLSFGREKVWLDVGPSLEKCFTEH